MKQAVIISGGFGTRLYPITKKVPKILVEISGKPFIDYLIPLCKKNGIEEIVFCVGHLWEQVRDYVGDGKKFGIKAYYSVEDKKLDTGGAIKKALPYLDKEFLVTYGDSFLDIDWQDVANAFKKSPAKGIMSVYENNWRLVPSTIIIDKEGYIKEFNKENPRPEMTHMEYGINIFSKDIIDKIPKEVFPLGDYFNYLAKDSNLLSYPTTRMFYDIGTPEGIKKFQKDILEE